MPPSLTERMNRVHYFQSSVTGRRSALGIASRSLSMATMSLGVAALMFNSACYAYSAKPPAELSPGENVVVALNNTGRDAIVSTLGDSIESAEGKFISNDVAGIHVNVTDVHFLSGISSPRSDVPITMPRIAFDSVTTKKLSIPMTTLLVAGIAAGLVALIAGVNVNPSGSPDSGGKKPPPSGSN
ncbi:MAG TPA: hypothetical protein VIC03_02435 [Gemmatimonadaceae bacterium]